MNVAASLVSTFFLPTGAFADIPDPSSNGESDLGCGQTGTKDASSTGFHRGVCPEHWDRSILNPRNRIDALGTISPSLWRIDGSCSQGIRFFATPVFLLPNATPRRIDVFVPDQTKLPFQLEAAFESSVAFSLMDKRVSQLGISQFLVEALNHRTVSDPSFVDAYLGLPFGSRIVVEQFAASARDVKMHLVPDLESERNMFSIEALQEMWALDKSVWPGVVPLDMLRVKDQIHDTVTLVGISGLNSLDETFVFKSAVEDIKYAYHELKMLLTIPSHPHIMPRPRYCVTMPDRYGGSDKLCGFILPFFPCGTLAEALCIRKQNGTLHLKDQIRWAKQITSALIFVKSTAARFYSELKPDNTILSDSPANSLSTNRPARDEESTHTTSIVLIDWEQMGNWMELTAPEVHYLDFAKYLAKKSVEKVPNEKRVLYERLLRTHMLGYSEPAHKYSNPPMGYFDAWNSLKPWQQEAAMVFALGMNLWCIFEGVPSPKNSQSKTFRIVDEQEFPQFSHRTPLRIQKLIKDCTKGLRSWSIPHFDIVRRGDKFYPRGKSGMNGEPVGTEHETRLAAKEMWKRYLSDLETFLVVKERYEGGGGLNRKADEAFLGYPLRPKLEEVLAILKSVEG